MLNSNKMGFQELKHNNYSSRLIKEIRAVLDNMQRTKTVAVVIDGKRHYMDEYQIRALQIVVNLIDEAAYVEFCQRVKIYNGRYYNKKQRTITILKDGRLSESFEPGFFDTSDKLAMTLLKMMPRLKTN